MGDLSEADPDPERSSLWTTSSTYANLILSSCDRDAFSPAWSTPRSRSLSPTAPPPLRLSSRERRKREEEEKQRLKKKLEAEEAMRRAKLLTPILNPLAQLEMQRKKVMEFEKKLRALLSDPQCFEGLVRQEEEGESNSHSSTSVPGTGRVEPRTLIQFESFHRPRGDFEQSTLSPANHRSSSRSPSRPKRVEFATDLEAIATIPMREEERTEGSPGKAEGKGGKNERRRSRSPSGALMHEIRKMSLASQDAAEEKKKSTATEAPKKGKKRKKKKREEEYTDKDRAAAVTLGSRDIKLSLKAKKKRERKLNISLDLLSSEEFLAAMLLVEASFQMRVKKDPGAALATLNKSLELQPAHRGALVARSQCYLKLGDAEAALRDAESSFENNESFINGLFWYAEALYNLGQFEKALIAFHRGHRVRRDMEGFRIGIQKSQEAIRRAIGDRSATQIEDLDEILPMIEEMEAVKNYKGMDEDVGRRRLTGKLKTPSKTRAKWVAREVLGQMYFDKDYLTKFLHRPDIQKEDRAAQELRGNVVEALNYLEIREEFWRQQNPMYARKAGLNMNNNVVLEYEEQEKGKQDSGRRGKESCESRMKGRGHPIHPKTSP